MAAKPKPRAIELTDPRALRALAHPARLALVGLLRREGPLTATQAATHLDDSSLRPLFHLRKLARYGLVEEAGGGHGRERPWQATATFTNWPTAADHPVAAAADQLSAILARRYFDLLIAWIGRRGSEPRVWSESVAFGDTMLYVTAEELAGLTTDLQALAEQYLPRTADASLRPEGARRIDFLQLALPSEPLPPTQS